MYFVMGVCKSKKRLDGKTVLITGADKGIGFETALDLAGRGARVIMACRDLTNAERQAQKIKEKTKNTNIKIQKIDLSSLKSVTEFAEKFLKEEERLDVLINNAGIPSPESKVNRTEEGFEITFVVNYLSHFLLTNLLLEKLKSCSPSRIVNVSSMAHLFLSKLDLEDLNCEKSSSSWVLYAKSKALQILHALHLSKLLAGSGVTINSLHPGVIKTNIFNKIKNPLGSFYLFISFLFGKSPKEGAQTSIHLAVSEEVEGVTGKYFTDCSSANPSKLTQDPQLASKIYQISLNYCKKNE